MNSFVFWSLVAASKIYSHLVWWTVLSYYVFIALLVCEIAIYYSICSGDMML